MIVFNSTVSNFLSLLSGAGKTKTLSIVSLTFGILSFISCIACVLKVKSIKQPWIQVASMAGLVASTTVACITIIVQNSNSSPLALAQEQVPAVSQLLNQQEQTTEVDITALTNANNFNTDYNSLTDYLQQVNFGTNDPKQLLSLTENLLSLSKQTRVTASSIITTDTTVLNPVSNFSTISTAIENSFDDSDPNVAKAVALVSDSNSTYVQAIEGAQIINNINNLNSNPANFLENILRNNYPDLFNICISWLNLTSTTNITLLNMLISIFKNLYSKGVMWNANAGPDQSLYNAQTFLYAAIGNNASSIINAYTSNTWPSVNINSTQQQQQSFFANLYQIYLAQQIIANNTASAATLNSSTINSNSDFDYAISNLCQQPQLEVIQNLYNILATLFSVDYSNNSTISQTNQLSISLPAFQSLLQQLQKQSIDITNSTNANNQLWFGPQLISQIIPNMTNALSSNDIANNTISFNSVASFFNSFNSQTNIVNLSSYNSELQSITGTNINITVNGIQAVSNMYNNINNFLQQIKNNLANPFSLSIYNTNIYTSFTTNQPYINYLIQMYNELILIINSQINILSPQKLLELLCILTKVNSMIYIFNNWTTQSDLLSYCPAITLNSNMVNLSTNNYLCSSSQNSLFSMYSFNAALFQQLSNSCALSTQQFSSALLSGNVTFSYDLQNNLTVSVS